MTCIVLQFVLNVLSVRLFLCFNIFKMSLSRTRVFDKYTTKFFSSFESLPAKECPSKFLTGNGYEYHITIRTHPIVLDNSLPFSRNGQLHFLLPVLIPPLYLKLSHFYFYKFPLYHNLWVSFYFFRALETSNLLTMRKNPCAIATSRAHFINVSRVSKISCVVKSSP